MNFFNLLIGEKFVAFQKLVQIRKIMANLTKPINVQTVIQLVFSLAEYGYPRKYSLNQILALNNLPTNIPSIDNSKYDQNSIIPSFLFILGFYLGDGSFLYFCGYD